MAKNKRNGKKKNKRPGVPRTNLARKINGQPNDQILLASGPVSEVTDRSFEKEVEQSDVPVLVDFWAPWCGPCKAVAPLLEDIAKEREGKLKIVKYNTEANSEIAMELGVRSIPTLALYKDGEVADVKVGASGRAALSAWIDKTLDPKPGLLGRLFG